MHLEYTILSRIIQHSFISRTTKMIVLRDHFAQDLGIEESAISYLKSCFKRMEEETLRNYLVKRSDCSQLQPLLELPLQFVLLSDQEANVIFQNGGLKAGWEEFYKK